jgi:hypothetical protein
MSKAVAPNGDGIGRPLSLAPCGWCWRIQITKSDQNYIMNMTFKDKIILKDLACLAA